MCILIHKPKGIDMPEREYLKNCFGNNPDGIGIAWVDNNGLTHIRKGFMKFKAFMKFIKPMSKVLKSCDVIIHFRWATHGSVSPGNCHPFPIDVNLRNLRSTAYSGRFEVLAHNGVIFEYGNVKNSSDLSDTMILAKRLHDQGIDSNDIQKVISTGGKFCISDKEGNIKRYGHFVEDMGIFWSNDTYLYAEVYKPVYKPVKYAASKYTSSTSYTTYDDYDADPFDDWYHDMILMSDLDDMGMCVHDEICKKSHECFICGLTIPEISKKREYTDICPFYQWKKRIDIEVCR